MFGTSPRPCLRIALAACMAATLSMVAACGSGGSGTGPGDNRPPVIDTSRAIVSTSITVFKPGDVVSFDIRALDPDIQAVSYSWSLSPDAGTGTFSDPSVRDPSWTVGSLRGTVIVTCVASDGELTDTWSRPFEVGAEIQGGEITGNVTWTRAGGPYVITGDVIVAATGHLTVEPGTRLYSRPRQSISDGGVSYTRRSIQVLGTLTFGAADGDVTLLSGGLLSTTVADAHFGIIFFDEGSGTLSRARIERARTAVQQGSTGTVVVAHQSLLTDNTENGVLVSATGAGRFEMRDSSVQDSPFGLTQISGTTELERVNFNRHGTALAVASNFSATGCSFRASTDEHLSVRSLGSSPPEFTVSVARSNFFLVNGGAPAVWLAENVCPDLLLEVRENFWGGSYVPDQILDRFARRDDCNAGVLGWTDGVCQDGSCDWSNVQF